MTGIASVIERYFELRGLEWPASEYEALAWAQTELGELAEKFLMSDPIKEWVRNNDHEAVGFNDIAIYEEAADVLLMMHVALMLRGMDHQLYPILIRKMEQKLRAEGKSLLD